MAPTPDDPYDGIDHDQAFLIQMPGGGDVLEREPPEIVGGDGNAAGDVIPPGELDAIRPDTSRDLVGPKDNPDPHISRERGEITPWESVLGPPSAPKPGGRKLFAPWARDDELGSDERSAVGFWGERPGDAGGLDGNSIEGGGDGYRGMGQAVVAGVFGNVDEPRREHTTLFAGATATERVAPLSSDESSVTIVTLNPPARNR